MKETLDSEVASLRLDVRLHYFLNLCQEDVTNMY